MEEDKRMNFFKLHFTPRRDYIVTPILFHLNFLLYLIVSVADRNFLFPSAETILTLGGDTPTQTLTGEYWRIITACFLHFGILHFAANMLAVCIERRRIRSNFWFTWFFSGPGYYGSRAKRIQNPVIKINRNKFIVESCHQCICQF